MLIYAKRSFNASPRRLARSIRVEVAAEPLPDLEQVRRWLIATGQLEQAVLDAGRDRSALSTAATLAAADVFLASRSHPRRAALIGPYATRLLAALARIEAGIGDCPVAVRVPEGFAWYALYPDSYAQTAERWAKHAGQHGADVCVIGLRSIGTALGAVVAQALRNNGCEVSTCLSLRPSGAPFDRAAELPVGFAPARQNIIVDEGPGLSGTSVVAVARALLRAGARMETIHFFPGHRNGPGPKADENVRSWWRGPRVWATDLDQTIVEGKLLPETLASFVETCTGDRAIGSAAPLGTVGWQSLAGLAELPRAAAPGLETPKKLVRLRSGRAVVLKFAGFALTGAEAPPRCEACDIEEIASIGACHGWVATPWVEGDRLTPADADVPFLRNHLGPWIAGRTGDWMNGADLDDAFSRIEAALEAWIIPRDGPAGVRGIERLAGRASAFLRSQPQRCCCDGRLAPHEWIRTPGGAITKVDAGGHDRDHTWVGRQPLAWDLAGAEIEWQLKDWQEDALCASVEARTGTRYPEPVRAFYTAGYCVFRAAAAHHCAMISTDTGIRARLLAASGWYERRMRAALASLTPELALS